MLRRLSIQPCQHRDTNTIVQTILRTQEQYTLCCRATARADFTYDDGMANTRTQVSKCSFVRTISLGVSYSHQYARHRDTESLIHYCKTVFADYPPPSKRIFPTAMQKANKPMLSMPSIIQSSKQSVLHAMRVAPINNGPREMTKREANGYRRARAERRVSPVKDCASKGGVSEPVRRYAAVAMLTLVAKSTVLSVGASRKWCKPATSSDLSSRKRYRNGGQMKSIIRKLPESESSKQRKRQLHW